MVKCIPLRAKQYFLTVTHVLFLRETLPFSGVLTRGSGARAPGKSFWGQHWGARCEAGNAIEMLFFSCYSPSILKKNEGCKVEDEKRNKDMSSYAVKKRDIRFIS